VKQDTPWASSQVDSAQNALKRTSRFGARWLNFATLHRIAVRKSGPTRLPNDGRGAKNFISALLSHSWNGLASTSPRDELLGLRHSLDACSDEEW
jgi:hypothetical protein